MGNIQTGCSRYSVQDARLEERIIAVIRAWAVRFPHELAALEQKVKFIRAHLHNERATGKASLHKAEIPVTLARAMSLCISPDWLDDVKVRNMFYRHFKVGLVNRTSVSKR